MCWPRVPTCFACLVSVALVGCASPLDRSDSDLLLVQRVQQAIERELDSLPVDETQRHPTQPQGRVEAALADRLDELAALGPRVPFDRPQLDLGPDLTGADQTDMPISLQTAITTAVRNNLGIQLARLQPAINEADVIAAQAVFDALFVSNVDLTKTDEPATVPILRGIQLGTPFSASEDFRYETAVRKRFTTGGEASISTDLTRFRNLAPGIALSPDPAYTGAIRLGLTQPLLRGFGSKVNTSTIRLAQNAEQRAIHELRADLMQLVADVDGAYWDLVFAWQNLATQQWLLEVGLEVRDVLSRRRDFDVTPAEESDAVARVEQRKANVIKARRAIRGASDTLKVFMNDAQLTVGSEALLLTIDQMVQSPIHYNLRQSIMTAVSSRPELQLAALGIKDAEIRQYFADNARLPLLNLSAQMAYLGLDQDASGAYDDLLEGNFIDYVLGFEFQWPLGNRAAEAEYRKARLQRSAAVITYQQAVQNVVLQVKASLRDVIANYELIQATRSFRVAQAENLRTFLVQEDLRGLTPERLNLKFQRQETLAAAQQEEIRSLVQYSKSVAALYRAMGVILAMNHIELEITDDGSSAGFDHAPPG